MGSRKIKEILEVRLIVVVLVVADVVDGDASSARCVQSRQQTRDEATDKTRRG
jgi:hypothetical protein